MFNKRQMKLALLLVAALMMGLTACKTASAPPTTDDGPRAEVTGATQENLEALDGSVIDEFKVTLSGNVNDFYAEDVTSSAALSPFTTALTVTQLDALVNGTVYPVTYDEDGNFTQEVPVDPGPNTIHLRVFDDTGTAYTTDPITVAVSFERLDLRVVLRWDTGDWTDVDLHMFKQGAAEGHTIDPDYFTWRDNGVPHVGWYSKNPNDFGSTPEENPFLDIDDTQGYGPETIVLQEMTDGNYHIWVHLFNLPGSHDATTATVDVYLGDQFQTFTKTLEEDWMTWYVATVSAPTGGIVHMEPTAP